MASLQERLSQDLHIVQDSLRDAKRALGEGQSCHALRYCGDACTIVDRLDQKDLELFHRVTPFRQIKSEVYFTYISALLACAKDKLQEGKEPVAQIISKVHSARHYAEKLRLPILRDLKNLERTILNTYHPLSVVSSEKSAASSPASLGYSGGLAISNMPVIA